MRLRAWRRHPGFTLAAVLTVGARRRRQHGHLQHHQHHHAAAAAVSRRRSTGPDCRERRPRSSDGGPAVQPAVRTDASWSFSSGERGRRRIEHMAGVINLMSGQLHTSDGPVPAPRAIVSPALFEMLGVAAAAWPHADSRRRAPGRRCSSDQRRGVAALLRLGSIRARPTDHAQQRQLHDRRRDAARDSTIPKPPTMFWTALAPRPGPGTNAFGNAIATLKADVSIERGDGRSQRDRLGAPRAHHPSPATELRAGPPPAPATATLGGQLRDDAGPGQPSALRGPARQRSHRRSDPAADASACAPRSRWSC